MKTISSGSRAGYRSLDNVHAHAASRPAVDQSWRGYSLAKSSTFRRSPASCWHWWQLPGVSFRMKKRRIPRADIYAVARCSVSFQGWVGDTFSALRQKPGVIRPLALGALVGPVLVINSSLLMRQHAEIGVASTLMACTKSHTFFCGCFPVI